MSTNTSRSSLLCLSDVVVTAGETRLLDGISIDVPAGRIVAVIGANGAGKTTLLDTICGVLPCHAGEVTVGRNAKGEEPPTHPFGAAERDEHHADDARRSARASAAPPAVRPHHTDRRRCIGRVFQGSPMPETLTVAEVCRLATDDKAAATELMARFGLLIHATTFVAELSTGMRRVLDLAVATVGDPDLLLLDEPASGLAASEVEHLAELLRRWRDDTGGSVLIVEHDPPLVREVADEVIVLAAGKVVAHGEPGEILDAKPVAQTRVRNPADEGFLETLKRVTDEAEPAVPPVRRVLSTWTLLRLGLREFAAGMASVLILGVLNRVMKVELGISLAVIAIILSSYNLAAPAALAIGHRSDSHPIFGRRRTPYIIGGATLAGLTVAAAPLVADRLADGIDVISVLLSLALFVTMGVGMYGAGTVFFALIADLAPPPERGHAASIVYFELMAGILAGVALTGSVVDDDRVAREGVAGLTTLFLLAGILIIVLTVIAVWGQESKARPNEFPDEPPVKFRVAAGSIAKMSQARLFFVFMVATTLFLFLQQAVLEPYGGEVLGLSVRQTASFNAIMTMGILIGMLVSGRTTAEKMGHKKIATYGLVMAVAGFAWLSLAAASGSQPPSWLSIFVIGLATGAFNVSMLALMMGMADARRTALFMGAWTVAHAVADGAAVAGGGILYDIAYGVVGTESTAYSLVFAVEAAGLALCLPMLRKLDPEKFAAEAAAYEPPGAETRPPSDEGVIDVDLPDTTSGNGRSTPRARRPVGTSGRS